MYDFIVIDLSHWLDELFLKVVTESDMLLMLTGLTVPDLRNLKKLWPYTIDWYQDKRKIKLVVNRYGENNDLQLRDLENILQHPPFCHLAQRLSGSGPMPESRITYDERRTAFQALAWHQRPGI